MNRTSIARLALAAIGFLGAAPGCGSDSGDGPGRAAGTWSPGPEASREDVIRACGGCHPYPLPETLPRDIWRLEVQRGYDFIRTSKTPISAPPMDDVVRYYQNRAPEVLPPAAVAYADTPPPATFERPPEWLDAAGRPPGLNVSNVALVHLGDESRLDVLACDMGREKGAGGVWALSPREADPRWRLLAPAENPAHAEVVDLDGDGLRDVLVACLGRIRPTDDLAGSVLWLRGRADGTFVRHVLLTGVGRVADVQAAPFRRAGTLDLVVAEFGWREAGRILLLENETTDWAAPRFVPREIDDRHGTIHVPVTDLDGDGRPDFVACISQEHEAIVAFVNQGEGRFAKRTLFAGPPPTYGSSGIQLTDMNGDGRRDVLYTNGDTLDAPYELKPYHGVQWLENPGEDSGQWTRHEVGPMYGVHRAVAADLSGDGRADVVAVSFLPEAYFPARVRKDADAVALFVQTPSGGFVRHALEKGTCDHATCVVGDVTGDGRLDLLVGNLYFGPRVFRSVTLWRNLGKP